ILNIWVKRIDEPFEAARPMTSDTARPVGAYFWSRDSRWLLYVQDKGGDENFRIYAVDPTAAPETATKTPPARDLTPYANVRAAIYAVPKRTPSQILVGLNDRDAKVHDVYQLEVATGKRKLVWRNDQNVAQWVADRDGKLRLASRIDAQGGTEILRVDGKRLVPAYRRSAEPSSRPIRYRQG